MLLKLAKSGEKRARVAAICAMPEIGDKKAVKVLKSLTKDSDKALPKPLKKASSLSGDRQLAALV
ncbi:MAG: hypothetical protein ABIH23_11130 [bacterium]